MKKGTRITYRVERRINREHDYLTCRYCDDSYERSTPHNFNDCVRRCKNYLKEMEEEVQDIKYEMDDVKDRLEERKKDARAAKRALEKAEKIQSEGWWKVPFAIERMNRVPSE